MRVLIRCLCMCAVLACLPAHRFCGAADGDEGEPDAAALTALLAQRRELLVQAQRERDAWAREKQDLETLLAERESRVASREVRVEALRKAAGSLSSEVAASEAGARALRSRVAEARAWVAEGRRQVDALLGRHPLLAEAAKGLSIHTDNEGVFWDALLGLAVRAVEPRVESRRIDLPDGPREVDVLFMGAVGALFISRDQRLCGLARPEGGALNWTLLPGKHLSDVARAVGVVTRDIPAEMALVPLPRDRLDAAQGDGR